MGPMMHIASGAATGCAIWAATGDINAAIWCGLGNVASDTDHLLEYGAYCLKRRQCPRLSEFMSGTYFAAKGTLMVLFHGHEYLLALALICFCLKLHGAPGAANCIAFTIGYGTHMLLDLLGNDCGLKGYSILYRVAMKFDERRICARK